jgi:ubiquinone/menaquinone biosynthesis C-methylase UbiE
MTTERTVAPNHHAHYPAMSGAMGLVAALSIVGREGDARLAARLSRLERGDVVVDVGCGPGTAARHAARLGATVTGVDPARVMLRVARLLTFRSPGLRYIEGAAEALPLPDDSATVVWSIASIHHWTDLGAGLAEVRRVLRPGGRFVAIERHTEPGAHGHASHGWTDAQAATFAECCCEEHGFIQPRIETNTDGRRVTVSVVVTRPL